MKWKVGCRRSALAKTELLPGAPEETRLLTLFWAPADVPTPGFYRYEHDPAVVDSFPALYWPEAVGPPADVHVVPSVPWEQGLPFVQAARPADLETPARAALLVCRALLVPNADAWTEEKMASVPDVLFPFDRTGCRRLPAWLFPCLVLAAGGAGFVERNGVDWAYRLAGALDGPAGALVRRITTQTTARLTARVRDSGPARPEGRLRDAPPARPRKRPAAGELLEAVRALPPAYAPATPLG